VRYLRLQWPTLLVVCITALAGARPVQAEIRHLFAAAWLPAPLSNIADQAISIATLSAPPSASTPIGQMTDGNEALPQHLVADYSVVTNQGDNPPVTYAWVEISPTAPTVAAGDDVFSQVQLGFPFAFYGITYTSAFVCSNGFIAFGSPSDAFEHTAIPDPHAPNNAIYAFWDDLYPTGGDNGSVYAQQTGPTTFIIEWHRVKRVRSMDSETFEVIINGADNTIKVQYKAMSATGSSTVGVENGNGTRATQYAYNSGGAIFDNLAIAFIPDQAVVYDIEGMVRDDGGAPVAEANVRIVSGPTTATTISGNTGAYSFSVMTGTYTLQADKAGYFTTTQRTVSVPPDQSGIDLTFAPRYTIRGLVRDADGVPVENALVQTGGGPVSALAWTDGNGLYTLTVLAGSYTVQASKNGYGMAPPRVVIVPPSRGSIDFTFPPRYTIRGTVRDYDGSPMAGIWVSTTSGDPAYDADVTNANGTYTLTVIPGTYHVRAAFYYDSLDPPMQTVIVPPNRTGVDFVFPRRYTIQGSVRDARGTAVSGAWVSTSADDPVSVSAATAANGSYTLTVIAGTYQVKAAKYYNELDPPAQIVSVPPSRLGVDFTFPQSYTVTGSVRDAGGAPLANIIVHSSGSTGSGAITTATGQYTLSLLAGLHCISVQSSQLAEPPPRAVLVPQTQTGVDFTFPRHVTVTGRVRDYNGAVMPQVLVRASGGSSDASTTTDSLGMYTLRLVAGTYNIQAEVDGRIGPSSRLLTVPPAQNGVDFVFAQTYSVAGTVRYANGSPLSGAYVTICPTIGGRCTSFRSAADGTYRLLAPAGMWQVSATAFTLPFPPPQTVSLPPARINVDFVFPTSGEMIESTITGTVNDTDGRPLPGLNVSASGGSCSPNAAATTTANGQYTLTVAASDTYLVEAGLQRRLATVPPTATLNITHPTVYPITGTVTDGGQPVPGVRVWTQYDHRLIGDVTDSAGRYKLLLPAGTYEVNVSRSGYTTPMAQNVTVPPARSNLDFAFSTGHRIVGLVLDGRGAAVADAQVQIVGTAMSGQSVSITVSSMSCGAYQVVAPSGTYTLTVSHPGFAGPAMQSVTLPPEQIWLNVTLGDLATISGTVRDNADHPVAGASIVAANHAGSYFAHSDANGNYRLSVQPGTYRLSAAHPDYADVPDQVVSVPPGRADVNLTFSPQYPVRGRVRDGSGAPIPFALVLAETVACGVTIGPVQADATGTYTLTLPAGDYAIRSSKDSHAATQIQWLTVSGPADGIDFTIPLPMHYTLSGIVRDGNGQPLAGAAVNAWTCGQPGSSTTTLYDGSYSLELTAGAYTILAAKTGYSAQSRSVAISADRGNIDFALPLSPLASAYTVYGYVTGNNSLPIGNAYVRIANEGTSDSSWTGNCGLYRLTVNQPGVYVIQAGASGYATSLSRTIVLPPSRPDVDVALLPDSTPRYTVSGNVRDDRGQPVAGSDVQVCSDDGMPCQRTTADSAGRYSFNLTAARYVVTVGRTCYLETGRQVTLPPDATVDLALHRLTNSIAGRVTNGEGAPLYGVPVRASGPDGQVSALTNSNGEYILHLPAGSWIVSAVSPGLCPYVSPPAIAVTTPPDRTGINFVMTEVTGGLTPTATGTPVATRTATPIPTSTPTPTSTPSGPWLAWHDGEPLLLLPGRSSAAVAFGNISPPAILSATIAGPAVFLSGGQVLTRTITATSGLSTLYLRPATAALPGYTFTLRVGMAGLSIERNGTIAWQLFLPVVLK